MRGEFVLLMASLAISWDFAISQNSDGLNIMRGAWLRIVKRPGLLLLHHKKIKNQAFDSPRKDVILASLGLQIYRI